VAALELAQAVALRERVGNLVGLLDQQPARDQPARRVLQLAAGAKGSR
jgi:hypothetical protein